VGVGSNVSLRGETVGSSNSNLKLPADAGAGMPGELVTMSGGLVFLASVGGRLPLDHSLEDLEAGQSSAGEDSGFGLCCSAGES